MLLKNLSNETDRYAEFVCVSACVFPDDVDNALYCRGVTSGRIIDEYRGEGGFGYDPLFYYEPMGKTYAEMTADEKNLISHRGKATEILGEKLKKYV